MSKQTRNKQFKPRASRLNAVQQPRSGPEGSQKELTYDQYLESMGGADKIIEISDDSSWDKLKQKTNKAYSLPKIVATKTALLAKKAPQRKKIRELLPSKLFTGKALLTTSAVLGVFVVGAITLSVFRGADGDNVGVVESAVTDNPGVDSISSKDEVLVSSTSSKSQDLSHDPDTEFSLYSNQEQDYTITVSQQAIPAENSDDPEGFLDIVAASFAAKDSFMTNKGRVFRISLGQEENPSQVAFFVKGEQVVFLRTQGAQLSPESWTEYINTLSL